MFYILIQSIVSGVMVGGMLSLVAVGLTLMFGVARVVNFGHGELLMVALYICFAMYSAFNMDPYLSILVTAPAMFLLGVLFYRLIIRPLGSAGFFAQIITTLGAALILRNLALRIFSADIRIVTTPFSLSSFSFGEVTVHLPRLVMFLVGITTIILLWLFLRRTDMGRAIRASAVDADAARLMGINVHRVNVITMGLATLCLGIAAPFVLPVFAVYPEVGAEFTLLSFFIIALGGMASFWGALIGGLLVGLTESVGSVFLTGSLAHALTYALFIVVLLFMPHGILGRRSA
ncbi:branched-chain amino acid ABC transporter permease [Chloroflexota bacterium]